MLFITCADWGGDIAIYKSLSLILCFYQSLLLSETSVLKEVRILCHLHKDITNTKVLKFEAAQIMLLKLSERALYRCS